MRFATALAIVVGLGLQPSHGGELRESAPSVRLVVPGPAGSTFDRYGRLVARHIGRFLPGRPVVVVQNMPGASGRVVLSFMCSVADLDGSAIGLMLKQVPMMQRMGEPMPCDVSSLHYIGSPARLPESLVLWHSSAKKPPGAEITIGATTKSGASFVMPQLMNNFLGTRFKAVTGYTGGPEIKGAMERGEVDGQSSEPWSEWEATKPDWVRDRKIVPIMQMGASGDPALPHVPLLRDVVKHPTVELASLTAEMSRPIVAPPGMSPAKVEALRRAFDQMVVDEQFLADAARMKLRINPISGRDLTSFVDHVMAAPQEAVDGLKAALRE
jgi:tripartite-type tricarboxylate transporter receptor subunit TctC